MIFLTKIKNYKNFIIIKKYQKNKKVGFYNPIKDPNKTITNPITPITATPNKEILANSVYSLPSGFLATFNTLLASLINLLKLS